MFETLWIQDCTKAELARRLKGYCAETNQPVTEESAKCTCVAHRLFAAETAAQRLANLVEAHKSLQAERAECANKCAGLEASLVNADANVVKFRASSAANEQAAQEAVAQLASTKRSYADAAQQVADLQREARDAKVEASAASSRLNAVLSTLNSLVN
jgi:chromosome segregation ATPase